jgi:glycerol-3-phosphate acyltransferase PlsY
MNAAGIVGLLAAYVIGSFPSAYLAGRILKGIDLRTVGSGNLGAANVFRVLGPAAAVVVLSIDVLKGAAPTLLLPGLLGVGRWSADASAWWAIAFGAAAIAGHAKPVFLLWRGGGKGVATAAGVFLAITPGPTALCVITFIVIVAATRYVSLGSIVAAAVLPVFEWLGTGASPVTYASVAVALFVTWAHRGNIVRLRAGTERRFGRPGGDKE